MRRRKSGFSLLEIAIILAVIGVAIGGLFIAASSLYESRRQANLQQQTILLVGNVRKAYTNGLPPGPGMNNAIAVDRLLNDKVLTEDMYKMDDYNYASAYGIGAIMAPTPQIFGIVATDISLDGCRKMLTQMFPTASAVSNLGLNTVATLNQDTGVNSAADVSDGITLAEAAIACTGTRNHVLLQFFKNL